MDEEEITLDPIRVGSEKLIEPDPPVPDILAEELPLQEVQQDSFSVVGSFNRLVNERDYTPDEATEAIAKYLLATKKGLTDEQIEAFYADPADEATPTYKQTILDLSGARDRSPIRAFLEGFGPEAVSTAVGMEAAVPAASAAFGVTPPLPVPSPVAVAPKVLAGATAGITAYSAASGLSNEALYRLLIQDPFLPEDMPAYKAGKAAGAVVGAARKTPEILAKLPERAVNLGSASVLGNIAENRVIGGAQKIVGKGVEVVEKAIPQMSKFAKENPRAVQLEEMTIAPSVGVAAGVAESYFPGRTLPAVGLELGAGIINPLRIVTTILSPLVRGVRNLFRDSDAMARDQASQWVANFIDEVGGQAGGFTAPALVDYANQQGLRVDVDGQSVGLNDVVQRFTDPEQGFQNDLFLDYLQGENVQLLDSQGSPQNIEDVIIDSGAFGQFDSQSIIDYIQNNPIRDPQTGQPVRNLDFSIDALSGPRGNPAVRLLVARFAQNNARFADEVQRANIDSINALTAVIQGLTESGTSGALKAASDLRIQQNELLIQADLDARMDRLLAAQQESLERPGVDVRIDAADNIRNLTFQALKDWRDLEKAAYRQVDMTRQAAPSFVQQAFAKIRAERLTDSQYKFDFDRSTKADLEQLTGQDALNETIDQVRQQRSAIQSDIKGLEKQRTTADRNLRKLAEQGTGDGRSLGEFVEELKSDQVTGTMKENLLDPDGFYSYLPMPLRKKAARLLDLEENLDFLQREINDAQVRLNDTVLPEFDPADAIPQDATVGDLTKIRSRLLALSRSEDVGNMQSIYGELADAILKDLKAVTEDVQMRLDLGEVVSEGDNALLRAYEISRAGSNIFRRTFASDVTGKTSTGAPQLPIEILATRLFSGGADLVNSKFNQLQEAVGFVPPNVTDDLMESVATQRAGEGDEFLAEELVFDPVASAQQRITSFNEGYDQIMRNMLNEVLETKTVYTPSGETRTERVVNPQKLTNLLNPETKSIYANLLAQPEFAGLKNDLQIVVQNREAIDSFLKPFKREPSNLQQLSEYDSPVGLIAQTLNDRKAPATAFQKLIDDVKQLGPPQDDLFDNKTRQEFTSAVFSYALERSSNLEGLSPDKMIVALFKPVVKDKPSIMQMLIDNKMIDPGVAKRTRELLTRMQGVETQFRRGVDLDELMTSTDPVTQFALRVIGARTASAVVPGQGGQIQIPAAGANLALSLFSGMPSIKTQAVIEEVIRPGNEAGFVEFLKQGIKLNSQQKGKQDRELARMLVRALGFTPSVVAAPSAEVRDAVIEGMGVTPAPERPAPSRLPEYTPPPNPVREPLVQVPPPMPPMQQSPAPQMGAPNPQQRAQYAALFPDDPTSEMIRGGIGSLG